MTFDEVLSKYGERFIVCLETAAGWLGLSSGAVYEETWRVYATEDIDEPKLEVVVISEADYARKETTKVYGGVVCTSYEQTFLDLLSYSDDVDIQTLLESISDYYFEHGESFDDLQLSEKQRVTLEKWKEAAFDYNRW